MEQLTPHGDFPYGIPKAVADAASDLRQELKRAWDAVDVPLRPGISRSDYAKALDEIEEGYLALYEKRWDEVTELDLLAHNTALSMIDRSLKPYYIGSYMDIVLQAVEADRIADVGDIVTRLGYVLYQDYWASLLHLFPDDQVKVIRRFLLLLTPFDEDLLMAKDAWLEPDAGLWLNSAEPRQNEGTK